MVFSWGGGGGEEETPGHRSVWFVFSLDDTSFRTSLFYVTYYILNSSGGFVESFADHHEGTPVPRHPGQCT
jgi:hypothetical protein